MTRREPPAESKSLRAALSRVDNLELPRPTPPMRDEPPEWPLSLADLSGEELSEQLTYWAAQIAYVQFELARADVERIAFEEQRSLAYTKSYLRSEKTKVTDQRENANADAEVIDARLRFSIHDATFRMLQALLKGYEAKYAAASRELSRRGIQAERGL